MRKNALNKIILLILTVFIAISVVACNGGKQNSSESSSGESSSTVTESTGSQGTSESQSSTESQTSSSTSTPEQGGTEEQEPIVDFVVDVEEGRDIRVMQITDIQIIDGAQQRYQARIGTAWIGGNVVNKYHNYLKQVVERYDPDLILMTGDNVYGSFDDSGESLKELISFMDQFEIPWAPVMGNHDVESNMGADWMCKQYENAPNCMFKQGDILGNGNYTIGIKQNGKLKRVIVNMDTNGCTGASEASKSNGHTVHHGNNEYGITYGTYGLQRSQVQWFQETIANIKEFVPDVKISFHFHIAMHYFAVAYNEAYKGLVGEYVAQVEPAQGAAVLNKNKILYPERVIGHREGDIGALMWLWQWTPDFWDRERINGEGKDHEIYYKMKATGMDSVFVGHYHSNSVSIVYDGIRFQYGQKCSTFDTTQLLAADGTITSTDILPGVSGTPLVGGTVIPMDKTTGELLNPYIQYCTGAGAEINWKQWENTIG